MATAFQANAFQDSAFQIDEVVVPVVSFLHDGGGAASSARKRGAHYRSAVYDDLLEKIRREGKREEAPSLAPALAPTLTPAEPVLGQLDLGTIGKTDAAVADIIRDAQAAAELQRIQDDEAIALLLLV